jgi:hypothetical protein
VVQISVAGHFGDFSVCYRQLTGQSIEFHHKTLQPKSVVLFRLEFSLQEEGLHFRLRS